MVTLGIDASTTSIGWSFFDNKKDIILDAGFIDIHKLSTYKEKANTFINTISSNIHLSETNNIVLEGALKSFSKGFSSQQTIIKLTRWNAVFEYILSEYYSLIDVNVAEVNTIRKQVFGKCGTKGMTAKEFVKMNIEERFPDVDKFYKLNTKGYLDKKNEDMLDAIVCSMYKIN